MATAPASRLRVLVVGAGFGGLTLVRALRHAPVDITLLDQHNHHLFTPLLYQVATALLDPSEIAYPVRATLRGQDNAHFRLGRLTAVHVAERSVETTAGTLAYDRLVLATGSTNNFFGNSSIEANAFGLKDLGDALALRNHVLAMFERAAAGGDETEKRRLLTIAVAGAGPTGVECSGAFRELAALVLRRDFRDAGFGDVDVELLEAAPQLLGSFAGSLQRAAARTLQRKGVALHLSTAVREITPQGVVLQDGATMPAATVVWTAGVKASPAGELLGVELGRSGRVPVDEWLRVAGAPGVYAIGDLAQVRGPEGSHPMLAPVAIQQAQHVAGQITAEVMGRPAPGPFRYRDKGTMATIGRNAAIAQIGPLRLHGLLGWLTWLFVHLVQIIGFRNRVVVLINWAWDYFLRDRPVRLIASAKRREDEPEI
jgi:NADH:ubiquinone reductase (H+-translocating)